MELILIRHGLPHRDDGGSGADPGLDPLGHRQAEAVAAWLADEPALAAIYTSPLRRARETAAPLATRLGYEPVVVDELAEWDRDADRYVHAEDLRALDEGAWQALAAGRLDAFGVDLVAFGERVTRGFDGIVAAHPATTVAVVCHGGVINTFLAGLLGLDRVIFFDPAYAGISRVLASRRGHRMVASVNETGHLRGLDRPGTPPSG